MFAKGTAEFYIPTSNVMAVVGSHLHILTSTWYFLFCLTLSLDIQMGISLWF